MKKNKDKSNILLMTTKERTRIVNIIFCLLALFGVFILPSLFSAIFISFGINNMVSSMLGQILYISLLIVIYFKDLKQEFKVFKSNIKSCFKNGFKYYIAGYMCMIFFNLIIIMLLKNISQNEEGVRELLYGTPVFAMINIAIFAPLAEELSFRKSLNTIFNNKYIFAIISGVLFGGAHLMTNILSNTFAITDLIYILPYSSLGFVFALMNEKTKTTFTSIVMHAFHNSVTCILLLIVHFSGVM